MSADTGPPLNRRELITGGVAGAASAMLVAQSAGAAQTQAPVSVTDRLQRLIRIELLLLFSYRHVLGSSILTPATQQRLSPFVAHEEAHIAALEQRLRARGGAVPAGPPDEKTANRYLAHRKIGGRLGALKGDLDAVRLLLALEQVTIGAYFVALTKLNDPDLIVLITEIMGNEAQHDAMLGLSLPPFKPGSAVPYGLVQGLQ
ncbi:MAG: ferritin-like domain-containing protein [Solirubrobacteraceae bacterium]|jgi:hypothetical protein